MTGELGVQVEPRKLLGLLANEGRLRVVAAIVLGAGSVEAVSAISKLDARVATRSLGQLIAGGLVEGDAAAGYRLRTEVFRDAAHGDGGGAAEQDALRGVVRNGRLPRSRAERLVVLRQLTDLFEPERRYPEAEVNSRLRVFNPDYALLRRYMIDEGLMQRATEITLDGRTVMVYWRTGKQEVT